MNKKISALDALGTTPAVEDIIPITDVSGTPTTKSVTVANLMLAAPVQPAGIANMVETTDSIGVLADVDTSTVAPTPDDLLKWNGTKFVPGTVSVDRLPTFSSTNRPANSSTGDIIYETDTGRISVYDANTGLWNYWIKDGAVDPDEIVNSFSSQYDATDDLGTASVASNSMSGDFTLSFWMNAASTSNHSMMSSNYGSADGWGLLRKGSNTFSIYYYYSGGSGWLYNGISTGMSDNAWTHIMLARTGSDLKTYVSGGLIDTTTLSNNISFSAGTLVTNSGYRSASYLDEVAVWSSDQSANIAQIRSASNKPKNLNSMSIKPLYWWRMGDDNTGQGTTISNNSSATGGNVNWLLSNGASINSSVKP